MSDRSIQEAVKQLAGTHLKDDIHICAATVESVNQPERTCICTPIGSKSVTDLGSVQLMPEVDDGMLLIPVIGSTVIVAWSTRNAPFILMYSAIQKMYLIGVDGIQFQGGELGGLPISSNIKDRLNLIENAFNALNAKVNTLAPTPVIPPLVTTATSQIENTSITQGV